MRYKKIREPSCEIIIKNDFNSVAEKIVKLVLAEAINGYIMLDYGYASAKSEWSRAR